MLLRIFSQHSSLRILKNKPFTWFLLSCGFIALFLLFFRSLGRAIGPIFSEISKGSPESKVERLADHHISGMLSASAGDGEG